MDKGGIISSLALVGGLVLTSAGLWLNTRADRRGGLALRNAQTQTVWAERGVRAHETETLIQGALDMATNLRAENAQLRHALGRERAARLEAQAEADRLRAALEAATPAVEALPTPAAPAAPVATPVAQAVRVTRVDKPAPRRAPPAKRRPGGGKPSTKRKGARRGR